MNPLDFLLAMNDIDAAAVDEAIELMHGGTVGNDTREVINLNKHRRKTLRRSALIAAIVALRPTPLICSACGRWRWIRRTIRCTNLPSRPTAASSGR